MSFIKLDRKIIDSEVFAHDGKLRFWIWLLVRARHESGYIAVTIGKGQHTIKLERGQLIFGRNSAENSLGVDGATLYKWLKGFEADGMVKLESSSHYTLLTINKYSDYQDFESEKVAAVEQPCSSNVASIEQPCSTKKKDNTDKKDKKDNKNTESAQIFSFKQSLLDNGADEQVVSDWIKVRKTKGATNTKTALNKFMSQVELSGRSLNEVLTKCVEKSWAGFEVSWKADWDTPDTKKPLPLPTAEQMKTETDKSILGRMFHIRDEFGLERNVLGYAVKSATVRYEILGEVFDAD